MDPASRHPCGSAAKTRGCGRAFTDAYCGRGGRDRGAASSAWLRAGDSFEVFRGGGAGVWNSADRMRPPVAVGSGRSFASRSSHLSLGAEGKPRQRERLTWGFAEAARPQCVVLQPSTGCEIRLAGDAPEGLGDLLPFAPAVLLHQAVEVLPTELVAVCSPCRDPDHGPVGHFQPAQGLPSVPS